MINPGTVNELYPIGAIALYPQSGMVSVLRSAPRPGSTSSKRQTRRGEVTYLSQKSLNRLIFVTQVTTIRFRSMLTLTYLCPPTNGTKAKKDLKAALGWIKRRKRGECEYVWFAEFTKAGSIHFHLLLDCVPSYDDRICFALYWLRKTDQGRGRYCDLKRRRNMRVATSIFASVSHPNSWMPLRSRDGAKRYIAKYAAKPYQKQVPVWFSDIGRFWGASKAVKENREEPVTLAITEDELRDYLVQKKRSVGQWDVVPKYLWGCYDLEEMGYGERVMSKKS